MGKLLDEILNPIYWEDTYERMARKENSTTDQINQLVKLNICEEYKTFVEEVKNGTFKWGQCEKQLLHKLGTKKKRTVYIYPMRDRYILGGGLYRVFSSYFSNRVSSHRLSYRRGVKTLTAIEYLMSDKELSNKYGVKLDISAYFNSVSEDYLKKVIDELMVGEPELKLVLEQLFFDNTVIYKGRSYKNISH